MEATSECVSHFLNSLFSLVKGDVKEEVRTAGFWLQKVKFVCLFVLLSPSAQANGQVRKKNKKKKSSRVQKRKLSCKSRGGAVMIACCYFQLFT